MTEQAPPEKALADAIARGLTEQSSKLQGLAATLEKIGGGIVLFGVVGAVLAAQSDRYDSFDSTGSNVAIGVAVGVAVQGLLIVGLAKSMGLFATYVQWRSALSGPATRAYTRDDSSTAATGLADDATAREHFRDRTIGPESPAAAHYAAGWYNDPYSEPNAAMQRWWDGERWTRSLRPQ